MQRIWGRDPRGLGNIPGFGSLPSPGTLGFLIISKHFFWLLVGDWCGGGVPHAFIEREDPHFCLPNAARAGKRAPGLPMRLWTSLRPLLSLELGQGWPTLCVPPAESNLEVPLEGHPCLPNARLRQALG